MANSSSQRSRLQKGMDALIDDHSIRPVVHPRWFALLLCVGMCAVVGFAVYHYSTQEVHVSTTGLWDPSSTHKQVPNNPSRVGVDGVWYEPMYNALGELRYNLSMQYTVTAEVYTIPNSAASCANVFRSIWKDEVKYQQEGGQNVTIQGLNLLTYLYQTNLTADGNCSCMHTWRFSALPVMNLFMTVTLYHSDPVICPDYGGTPPGVYANSFGQMSCAIFNNVDDSFVGIAGTIGGMGNEGYCWYQANVIQFVPLTLRQAAIDNCDHYTARGVTYTQVYTTSPSLFTVLALVSAVSQLAFSLLKLMLVQLDGFFKRRHLRAEADSEVPERETPLLLVPAQPSACGMQVAPPFVLHCLRGCNHRARSTVEPRPGVIPVTDICARRRHSHFRPSCMHVRAPATTLASAHGRGLHSLKPI